MWDTTIYFVEGRCLSKMGHFFDGITLLWHRHIMHIMHIMQPKWALFKEIAPFRHVLETMLKFKMSIHDLVE